MNEIHFRIFLEHPTEGVDYALQKGKGTHYECVQKHRSEGKTIRFEFQAGLVMDKDKLPDFRGPFIQGPPRQRFVYLDIGQCAGQKNTTWSRRLKIPLTGISQEILQPSQTDISLILETKIPGSGPDGIPSCAIVKFFPGLKKVSP